MYAWPHLVVSWWDTMNLTKKNDKKKYFKTEKKIDSPYYNIPIHTHDTVVWVHGMPQYAEIHTVPVPMVPMTQSPWVFPFP